MLHWPEGKPPPAVQVAAGTGTRRTSSGSRRRGKANTTTDGKATQWRSTPRKRRELIEAYLQLEPAPALSDLHELLSQHGLEPVHDRTISRDLAWVRGKVAEDPAVPAQFGFVVGILAATISRSFNGGNYQTCVSACRELKELLHLDEVIPSAMLKAKTAAAADTSEIRDLFAALVNLTDRSTEGIEA